MKKSGNAKTRQMLCALQFRIGTTDPRSNELSTFFLMSLGCRRDRRADDVVAWIKVPWIL